MLNGDCVEIGDRITWSTRSPATNATDATRIAAEVSQSQQVWALSGLGREALSGGFAKHVLLRVGSSIAKVSDAMRFWWLLACPATAPRRPRCMCSTYAHPGNQARVLILGAGMLGLTAAAIG